MTGTASNRERYRKLIASAQQSGGLWIADSAGLALVLPNESGEPLILVWPTAEAARAVLSAQPNLSRYEPVHRTLDRWLNHSIPHLIEDGMLVAANPDENLSCLKVPAASFAKDLLASPKLQGKDLSRLRKTR